VVYSHGRTAVDTARERPVPPAPKEQPPRETLRHPNRAARRLWKASRWTAPPKGKAGLPVNLSGIC